MTGASEGPGKTHKIIGIYISLAIEIKVIVVEVKVIVGSGGFCDRLGCGRGLGLSGLRLGLSGLRLGLLRLGLGLGWSGLGRLGFNWLRLSHRFRHRRRSRTTSVG